MSIQIVRVPLRQIREANNPRNPLVSLHNHLKEESLEGSTLLDLVQNLAFNDSSDERAKYVALIEKYESGPRQIVELAASRAKSEIEPVILRVVSGDGDDAVYSVVVGERRVLAGAYNFAKHGTTSDIGAEIRTLTADEAYDLAVDENFQRKELTDLEVGEWVKSKLKVEKAKRKGTGEKYSLKDFAAAYGADYQYLLSREYLTFLPEELKKKLAEGKLGLTAAVTVGRKIKAKELDKDGKKIDGTDGAEEKSANRSRVVKLVELHELFDKARKAQKSDDYLAGLAAAGRLTLKQATKESEERVTKAAEVKARGRKKKNAEEVQAVDAEPADATA